MAKFDPTTDTEYQRLDSEVQKLNKQIADAEAILKANPSAFTFVDTLRVNLARTTAERDNLGAKLQQGSVNAQTATAGAEAIKNENLLARNINQEITGRIAQNTQQAGEALVNVDLQQKAKIGQQAAKAGQAGYNAESGTAGALTEAVGAKIALDKAALEDLRLGRQNLLLGQGTAATKAAESLAGSIDTTTKDWADKSTSAVTEVTDTRMKNLLGITEPAKIGDFTGQYGDFTVYKPVDTNTPGMQAASKAIDTTLDTWSMQSYTDVLNTLTSHSANKTTWDQMLLDKVSAPVNPYQQFDSGISPLTPLAGTQSNLLAAAAGSPDVYTSNLSGTTTNKTGRLI